jgi:hypothetical protein
MFVASHERASASLGPDYDNYQRKSDHQIPVFVLEPVSGATPASPDRRTRREYRRIRVRRRGWGAGVPERAAIPTWGVPHR